jgi:hypothetical protein
MIGILPSTFLGKGGKKNNKPYPKRQKPNYKASNYKTYKNDKTYKASIHTIGIMPSTFLGKGGKNNNKPYPKRQKTNYHIYYRDTGPVRDPPAATGPMRALPAATGPVRLYTAKGPVRALPAATGPVRLYTAKGPVRASYAAKSPTRSMPVINSRVFPLKKRKRFRNKR